MTSENPAGAECTGTGSQVAEVMVTCLYERQPHLRDDHGAIYGGCWDPLPTTPTFYKRCNCPTPEAHAEVIFAIDNDGDQGTPYLVMPSRAATATTRSGTRSTGLPTNPVDGKSAVNASHRFNNDLRYRTGDHEAQRQLTPPYVLDPVRAALGRIGLDPCTEADNPTGAERFYTIEDDGLEQPWSGPGWLPTVFVNPPYSKAREPWVRRCVEGAERYQAVVLLMPAHTDTRIFQAAMDSAAHVVFIKGRVKFGVLRENRRQEAASHPSALICWNGVDVAPLRTLGRVVQL